MFFAVFVPIKNKGIKIAGKPVFFMIKYNCILVYATLLP